MKKLLLLSTLILSFSLVHSQCSPAIPNTAYVVSSTQSIGFGGADIWVCPGDSLTTNGGSEYIYLESTAYVLTNGGSNFVWVPQGAKVNTPSGGNTIYYVDPADLVFTGGATLIQCTSINYDYSNAPTNGCQMTTGIKNSKMPVEITIYPNPSQGKFILSVPGMELSSIEVLNSVGARVFSSDNFTENACIDLSGMPKGIYLIHITGTDGNWMSSRIVIE
jgi:hypothetical protein